MSHVCTDYTCFLLQKIRKKPALYLGTKSLEFLSHFLGGYEFRNAVEEWTKSTGHDFIERFDDFIVSINQPSNYHSCLDGFYEFVHSYFDVMITTKSLYMVIIENSNSQEEAFDTFYKLLDEFLAKKSSTHKTKT